jgi:hypothetical protein
MKHRHSGKYKARKPKGGTCTKRKPVHKKTSKKVPKGRISQSDKNLTWNQVKKKYPGLNPFDDFDGDGKKNYEDCRPLDKSRQDVDEDGYTFKGMKEELKTDIRYSADNLMYRPLRLNEVEQLAEDYINKLKDRKVFLNEWISDKRRFLKLLDSLMSDPSHEGMRERAHEEIDKMVEERKEINKFIKWASNFENLMTYLPRTKYEIGEDGEVEQELYYDD